MQYKLLHLRKEKPSLIYNSETKGVKNWMAYVSTQP